MFRRALPIYSTQPSGPSPDVLGGISRLLAMDLAARGCSTSSGHGRHLAAEFIGSEHEMTYQRLLKTADVLVLASLWEGMPNVVLEAMAASRPVVATAVEGTEELVISGQTGWLVPPRDSEALSTALLEAASTPNLCYVLGCQGRVRVGAEFSIDQTVIAYERLWYGLLGYQPP